MHLTLTSSSPLYDGTHILHHTLCPVAGFRVPLVSLLHLRLTTALLVLRWMVYIPGVFSEFLSTLLLRTVESCDDGWFRVLPHLASGLLQIEFCLFSAFFVSFPSQDKIPEAS
ncbi:hypothetical protein PIB30_006292 [Stylosanthes scabra]|uniref:Uncharacterized protein n=1 Tax=Stylosanthes scabra TaxID=79078 RepID=A0ABU6Q4B0_9FABA|nr:hypothetical protein [Stylosanthes scabra]